MLHKLKAGVLPRVTSDAPSPHESDGGAAVAAAIGGAFAGEGVEDLGVSELVFEEEGGEDGFEVAGCEFGDGGEAGRVGVAEGEGAERGEASLVELELGGFGEVVEVQLDAEAAEEGVVELGDVVGGGDEDATEVLHAAEELVDPALFAAVFDLVAIDQDGVGFVEEEEGLAGFGVVEGGADLLLGFADVFIGEVGAAQGDEFKVNFYKSDLLKRLTDKWMRQRFQIYPCPPTSTSPTCSKGLLTNGCDNDFRSTHVRRPAS